RSDRVNVAGGTDGAAPGCQLLRRHVTGRPEQAPCAGKVSKSVQPLGQTEIQNTRLVVRIDQNIGWFEVAVSDALDMGVADRLGNGFRVTRRTQRGNGPVSCQLRQARSLHQVHGEVRLAVVLAEFMNSYDVGMPQTGYRLGFSLEAGKRFRAARE